MCDMLIFVKNTYAEDISTRNVNFILLHIGHAIISLIYDISFLFHKL